MHPHLTAQIARAHHTHLLADAERHRLSRRIRAARQIPPTTTTEFPAPAAAPSPGPGTRPRLRLRPLMLRNAATALALVLLVTTAACAAPPRPLPPRFLNPATATFTAGTTAVFTISTTGPAATITASGTLPTGLTFKHSTRGTAFAGTLARNTGGRYILLLHARNGAGRTSQRLILTIDQAPQFTTADRDTIYAVALKHDTTPITTTGYPAATITETGTLPTGLTFRSSAQGTALISGTPGLLGSPGDFTITLTAWNPAGSATKTVTVIDINMVTACVIICPLIAAD